MSLFSGGGEWNGAVGGVGGGWERGNAMSLHPPTWTPILILLILKLGKKTTTPISKEAP
jgi:hypothetical protein